MCPRKRGSFTQTIYRISVSDSLRGNEYGEVELVFGGGLRSDGVFCNSPQAHWKLTLGSQVLLTGRYLEDGRLTLAQGGLLLQSTLQSEERRLAVDVHGSSEGACRATGMCGRALVNGDEGDVDFDEQGRVAVRGGERQSPDVAVELPWSALINQVQTQLSGETGLGE